VTDGNDRHEGHDGYDAARGTGSAHGSGSAVGADELRARLREAAGAHTPDRARMLARIERGMRAHPDASAPAPTHRPRRADRPDRPALGWARIAGVTAVVAGLLTAGGFAVGAALRPDETPPQRVAVSPSGAETAPASSPDAVSRPRPPDWPTAPERTPAASVTPPHRSPSGAGSAKPPAGAGQDRPSAPTATATADGPLWADGSVDPGSQDAWAQSNVTFKTKEPLSALTVELRIARTGRVASTGNWRTLPADDFTVSVAERDGFLVYRWVLRAGRTVPAGQHVFAGQYDHAPGGRDASGDRYTVTAETARGGERAAVGGDFA
jgi:hypothetical protein